MTGEHVIADEVVELANLALSKGENWMVYNQTLYFLDRDDIHFLKPKMKQRSLQKTISATGIIITCSTFILCWIYTKHFLMDTKWRKS